MDVIMLIMDYNAEEEMMAEWFLLYFLVLVSELITWLLISYWVYFEALFLVPNNALE